MNFINKNLEKVGIVNILLIIVVFILKISQIGDASNLMAIDSILCLVALASGVLYTVYGYKKSSAEYYKIFMLFFCLSALISFLTSVNITFTRTTLGVNVGTISLVASFIITICAYLLAFGKNLGVKKSINLGFVIIGLNLFKFVSGLGATKPIIVAGLANLVLSFITLIFVSAKYADKASRGAK